MSKSKLMYYMIRVLAICMNLSCMISAHMCGSVSQNLPTLNKNFSLEEQLFEAIVTEQEEKVKDLIAQGVNVNAVNKEDESAIELASRLSLCCDGWSSYNEMPRIEQGDILWQLIEAGASLGKYEWIVRKIVASGSMPGVLLLAKKGIALQKYEGILLDAANSGDEAVFKHVLALCPDVNYQNKNGNTPLIMATQSCYYVDNPRNYHIVRLLLERGAKVNHKNQQGESALLCAVAYANEAIVKLLLNNGADWKAEQKNLLLKAVADGDGKNEKIISLLIDLGVGLEEVNEKKQSSLHIAAGSYSLGWRRTADPVITELLLQKGANPNSVDVNGRTPLINHIVNTNGCYFSLETVKILLKYGADQNIKDKDGKSALDYLLELIKKEECSAFSNTSEITKLRKARDFFGGKQKMCKFS